MDRRWRASRSCAAAYVVLGGYSGASRCARAERPTVCRARHLWVDERQRPAVAAGGSVVGAVASMVWRTQLLPHMLRSEGGLWLDMLHKRQWLWDNGDWRDPFGDKRHFASFHGKEKAEAEGTHPRDLCWQLQSGNLWRLLQKDPECMVTDLTVKGGKLLRMASELVTAPRHSEDRGPLTDRENRHHRQMMQLYRRRCFVRNPDHQVVFVLFFLFPALFNVHFPILST